MASTPGGMLRRSGSLEIEHELELGWPEDRQVGGLFAFEDAADVESSLTIGLRTVIGIAHQPACCDYLSDGIRCRHSVRSRQGNQLTAPKHEIDIRADHKRVNALAGKGRKQGGQLPLAARIEYVNLLPDRTRRRLNVGNIGLSIRIGRVDQKPDDG